MHQLCTIVVFVTERIVVAVYDDVSTEDDDEGTKMFSSEISRKPPVRPMISKMYWITTLSQRVDHVMCWFSQIISPG